MTPIAIHRPGTPCKRSVAARIAQALSVRRQRAQLARLDSRALDDIGVSRPEVEEELSRSVWDVPPTWKR